MEKLEGVKHLIECNCQLPQFRNKFPPIFHKFVVFSVMKEPDAEVIPSYVQCPNCSVVHKVIEIGQSIILKKEESSAVVKIEDVKLGLPEKLIGILDKYESPLATFQEVSFILENKLWGRGIILSKEKEADKTFGMYLLILGENLFKIEQFEREEGLV